MSLRTCSWLFLQNEQRYGTLVPFEAPVVVTGTWSPVLPVRRRSRQPVPVRVRHGRSLAAREARIMRLRDEGVTRQRVDSIDDAIRLRVVGPHEQVTVRVLVDLLVRLPGVLREDLRVALDQVLPLAHLDHRIRRVATEPAAALVDHDPAVGE